MSTNSIYLQFFFNFLEILYPNNLQSRLIDGIESCLKSTTAGFVNDSVLVNTGSFTIVDFRRFEPAQRSTFESREVYGAGTVKIVEKGVFKNMKSK